MIAAKVTLSNAGKADYYEIGSDKVPALLLTLSGNESRKLSEILTSSSTGGFTTTDVKNRTE